MSLDIKELIQKITPYMTAYAFKRVKKCFYAVANNIAFCVEFEKPGNLIYVNYYVIPLYIPHENRCFTYGNRIVINCNSTIQRVDQSVNGFDIDISERVEQLKECLQQSIFPLFKTISTPNKLVDAVSDCGKILFFCTDIDILRLQFFTYAFLDEQEKCVSVERRYRHTLSKTVFLHDAVKGKYLDEIDNIRLMTSKGTALLSDWFKETIINTLIVASFR